jgi:hypothetical protein
VTGFDEEDYHQIGSITRKYNISFDYIQDEDLLARIEAWCGEPLENMRQDAMNRQATKAFNKRLRLMQCLQCNAQCSMVEKHAPTRAFCNKQCQVAHHYNSIQGVLRSDDDPAGDIQLTKEEEARAAYFTENNQQWTVKSAASKRIIAQFLKDPTYNIRTTAAANDIFLLFDVLEDAIPLMIPALEENVIIALMDNLTGKTGWLFLSTIKFSTKMYYWRRSKRYTNYSSDFLTTVVKECVLYYHGSDSHAEFLNNYMDEKENEDGQLLKYALQYDNNGSNIDLVKILVSKSKISIDELSGPIYSVLDSVSNVEAIEPLLLEYIRQLSPETTGHLDTVVLLLIKWKKNDLLESVLPVLKQQNKLDLLITMPSVKDGAEQMSIFKNAWVFWSKRNLQLNWFKYAYSILEEYGVIYDQLSPFDRMELFQNALLSVRNFQMYFEENLAHLLKYLDMLPLYVLDVTEKVDDIAQAEAIVSKNILLRKWLYDSPSNIEVVLSNLRKRRADVASGKLKERFVDLIPYFESLKNT